MSVLRGLRLEPALYSTMGYHPLISAYTPPNFATLLCQHRVFHPLFKRDGVLCKAKVSLDQTHSISSPHERWHHLPRRGPEGQSTPRCIRTSCVVRIARVPDVLFSECEMVLAWLAPVLHHPTQTLPRRALVPASAYHCPVLPRPLRSGQCADYHHPVS